MEEVFQLHIKTAGLRFYSDALVLKTLCAPESLQDLERIRESLDIHRRRGTEYYSLVNGYKLAVATPLYSLIDYVINFSSLVGLEVDNRLAEWWGWRENSEGVPARSAFTYPDSDLADLVVSLQDLAMRLPKSDTWQSFQETLGSAYTLGDILYESALGSSVYWIREQFEDLDTPEAIRRGAIERVDDYLNSGIMSSTYQFAWGHENRRANIMTEIMDDFWHETESHMDPPPLDIPQRKRALNWGKGILAAISIALSRLGFEGRVETDGPALFKICTESPRHIKENLHEALDGNWPSLQYGLNPPVGVPLDRLIAVKGRLTNIHSEQRLRDLVGSEEGRILGSYPVDAFDFPMLLELAVSKVTDENRVEVVRVKHPVPDSSELTWYSLAIRTPRFGLFSNASKWWVFYKAHGFGQMADSEVYHAERLVNESLVKFAGRINLIELEQVDERSFLSLFEPPVWRTVFNGAKELNDINSDLRGVVPELLATELLARRDYRSIRSSFKPQVLGGLELDSLGIRPGLDGGECLVMEIKGQSSTDQELTQELDRFAAKVRTLKNNLPELAREVGYEGEIRRISGTFVSMGHLQLEYNDPDVRFLDYDGFIAELRRAGIPSRLFKHLQPTPVYRLTEFAADAWFQANDGNEEPDASGPVGEE